MERGEGRQGEGTHIERRHIWRRDTRKEDTHMEETTRKEDYVLTREETYTEKGEEKLRVATHRYSYKEHKDVHQSSYIQYRPQLASHLYSHQSSHLVSKLSSHLSSHLSPYQCSHLTSFSLPPL